MSLKQHFMRSLDSNSGSEDEFPAELLEILDASRNNPEISKKDIEDGQVIGVYANRGSMETVMVGKYRDGEIWDTGSIQYMLDVTDGNPAHEFSKGNSPALGANIHEALFVSLPTFSHHVPDRGYSLEDGWSYDVKVVDLEEHADFEPLEYIDEFSSNRFIKDSAKAAHALKQGLNYHS